MTKDSGQVANTLGLLANALEAAPLEIAFFPEDDVGGKFTHLDIVEVMSQSDGGFAIGDVGTYTYCDTRLVEDNRLIRTLDTAQTGWVWVMCGGKRHWLVGQREAVVEVARRLGAIDRVCHAKYLGTNPDMLALDWAGCGLTPKTGRALWVDEVRAYNTAYNKLTPEQAAAYEANRVAMYKGRTS